MNDEQKSPSNRDSSFMAIAVALARVLRLDGELNESDYLYRNCLEMAKNLPEADDERSDIVMILFELAEVLEEKSKHS